MNMSRQLSSLTIIKQKFPQKISNHQKASKTRRQRGYQWEDTIVKRFRKQRIGKHFD